MQAAQNLVVVPRTMGGDVFNRLIGTCKADFERIDDVYVLVNDEVKIRCQEVVQRIASRQN